MSLKATAARTVAALAANASVISRDAAGLAGVGLISYGAWLAWPPAGFLVAGGFLFAAAMILGGRAAS